MVYCVYLTELLTRLSGKNCRVGHRQREKHLRKCIKAVIYKLQLRNLHMVAGRRVNSSPVPPV